MEASEAARPAEGIYRMIELAAAGVDLLAAVVIIVGMLVGTLGFLAHWRPRSAVPDYLEGYREKVGKALLLALELLVAADILETIVLGPNLQDVTVLAVLVVVRTFLSWTLELEIDHRWPWQAPPAAAAPADESAARRDD